jgi:hypothetical protein
VGVDQQNMSVPYSKGSGEITLIRVKDHLFFNRDDHHRKSWSDQFAPQRNNFTEPSISTTTNVFRRTGSLTIPE